MLYETAIRNDAEKARDAFNRSTKNLKLEFFAGGTIS